MPRKKYKAFTEALEKASAFSYRPVESRMGSYGKVFIHNMKKQGRIIGLMKGWYSFKKNPYLLTIPLGEAYVGLGSAASIRGMWNQVPNIDILTTRAPRKVKVGEREVAGSKVIVRSIDRRLYFGFSPVEVDGSMVRVSDKEKTLIDLAYFNYPFLPEILEGAGGIDRKKMGVYMKRIEGIKGAKRVKAALKGL